MTREVFEAVVPGEPEPAGSPKVISLGGRPAIRWQKGPRWTNRVRSVISEQIPLSSRPWLAGPAAVVLEFRLLRPKKPMFEVPATKPDIDKLARATLDGLFLQTGRQCLPLVLVDDARVVKLEVLKTYTENPLLTGVTIKVEPYGCEDVGPESLRIVRS